MFTRDMVWTIRCDTHTDEDNLATVNGPDKDGTAAFAVEELGWDIRDDLHRCPRCVREGRTAVAS